MSDIQLFLFGAPRIERGGSPVEVDTRKAVALVSYLAIEGQAFRRDSLAGLLWPEHDSNQARGALRRTLSTLKKAMGGEGLVADRATVGLAPDSVSTDAVTFRSLVEQSEPSFGAGDCVTSLELLEQAVDLYRGDFLAGFSLRDSVTFEDWQYYQAEFYKRLMATALERTVECLSINRRFSEAIERAHRWLSLDPLHEPAHRKLMLLYAWNDQRAGALKQYRECVALLDRELGVIPLEETTELYRQITDNEVVLPEQPAVPARPPIALDSVISPSPVPLVGRDDQLQALIRIHETIAGGGRVALIEGEAGIGKSRLAEEFVERARSLGAVTATARCNSEEMRLAFGALTELMRSTLEGRDPAWLDDVPRHWLTECSRLLPELLTFELDVPAPTPLDDPGAQARFFEGIASFLAAASDSSPAGVLLIDDIHCADESSMDALLYLATRLKGRRLLLLTTVRSEEPLGGPRARHLLSADRSGTSSHIVLDRLTRTDVAELVTAVRSQDASLSDRLYEETEGLPFFLVEYLVALEGGADPDSPEWSPPTGVRELVSSRLERLSEMTLQVLTAAAIIGRSFDFDTVREAGGRSEDETVMALDELASGGLVKEIGATSGDGIGKSELGLSSPTFDFSHEGIRRIVLDDTSTARRRLLHRRVGESVARSRRRAAADPGAVAQHYEAAGDAPAAAHYYEVAGDKARSLLAHAEALAHYRAALGLDHPEPFRIHEAIADVSVLTGDYSSALTSYETAAALSDQHDLVGIEHKIGSVHHRRGDLNAAQSHLEVAFDLLDEGEHARRARVLADLSLTAHRSGDSGTAERLAGEALELAEKTEELDALAQVHNILGILAKSRSDFPGALDHLQRSADLAAELSDPTARIAALNNLALAQGETGDRATAIAVLEEAVKLCTAQRDRHREAALHNNLADLWHREGNRERSMEHLKRAVAIFAEIGSRESTMQPEIWKLVEW
ncbi:MAG: AAA family ATPase [Actinobacteria bacterium]|nr:AAA family ATPase [Actinomycetota bacterium]